jgi:(p)ppGpp synthase/HD superfamily hydrolase
MSARLPHDHPMTATALSLARQWCHGHEIGGEPALSHALRVTQILHHLVPDARPDVLAAALVHDAPDFAPTSDLDAVLSRRTSKEVTRIVRALTQEHLDLAAGLYLPPNDPAVVVVSAADKLVSIGAVLDGAATSRNPAAYWRQRRGFVAALSHFRSFLQAGTRHMPAAMAGDLDRLIDEAERTIRRCRMSGADF